MIIIQYMDDDSATAVRCVVGVAEDFDVNVGLHQGFEPMFFCNRNGYDSG